MLFWLMNMFPTAVKSWRNEDNEMIIDLYLGMSCLHWWQKQILKAPHQGFPKTHIYDPYSSECAFPSFYSIYLGKSVINLKCWAISFSQVFFHNYQIGIIIIIIDNYDIRIISWFTWGYLGWFPISKPWWRRGGRNSQGPSSENHVENVLS